MSAIALILDNGAYTAKIGFASNETPKIIPNCIMKAKSERRRPFIGDQIEECRDVSGLYYILCFQKGYLMNWDIQKTVWDYMFSECCRVSFAENPLIITHPQFNFHSIQEAMAEIFFEEYEFEKLLGTTASDLSSFKYYADATNEIEDDDSKAVKPLCCIVVDIGYSFTHVVPFIKDKKFKPGIRRIDVGGKLMTNHLKEIISYRQLNVMDESYVINQLKEDSCFASYDFQSDMRIARMKLPDNKIIREYVLPDFTTLKRGFLREINKDSEEDQQALVMNNERFSIPEVLFHPSDVGILQMGIPEAIMNAIQSCPEKTVEHLLSNITVCGGSAMFPGIEARLQKDIRALAPDIYNVSVKVAENPIENAWLGGQLLSEQPDFSKLCVTREEYEEEGNRIVLEKFDI